MRHNATSEEARRIAHGATAIVVLMEPQPTKVVLDGLWEDYQFPVCPYRPGEPLEIYRTVEFEDEGESQGPQSVEELIGSPLIASATAKTLGALTLHEMIACLGGRKITDERRLPRWNVGDEFREWWTAAGRVWDAGTWVWVVKLEGK